ncbi:TPA: ketol-acid reductoisomerase [Candidatus Bathyarchaeota archaeon]|nr:ketol-acid reductoisomerase [Candidatus Bathyarchaeota archaeon]
MVKVYYDEDADLSVLKGKTMAIIGYGNQGRAQGLNMRDSGLEVIVGSRKDPSWDRAVEDGFKVYPIREAAELGDAIFMLVPDEAQREVFEKYVRNGLKEGKALVFAHGYNIHYGFISPPSYVDVIMVAPRMIGWGLRELFLKGQGAPAYVAVQQDASGKAKEKALAIAKAIGATRAGAIELSFAEETEIDHFMEQAVWAAIDRILTLSFEVLVEAGYPPEVVSLELYGSGEAAEVMRAMAEMGLFKQMALHSQTSQYGTLSRGPRVIKDDLKRTMRGILEEIKLGVFAREWELEQKLGYPVFNKLKERALKHPINEAEEAVKKLLRKGS